MNESHTKRTIAFYPLLVPVLYTFHTWCDYPAIIHNSDVIGMLWKYLLGVALCFVLGWVMFKNQRKAALFTFISACIFFFFGALLEFLKSHTLTFRVSHYMVLLPAIFIFWLLCIWLIRRRKSPLFRATLFLNVTLSILSLLDISRLLVKRSQLPVYHATPPAYMRDCDSCGKPDVYFILADEYAGSRELKDILGFDNSAFENALRQRSFYLPDSSHSNYNYTPFSMASIFSMNYLTNIEGRNQSVKDRSTCYIAIDRNPVTEFFLSAGYDVRNLSVFQFNGDLPIAHSEFFPTGSALLHNQTLPARFDHDVRFKFAVNYKWTSQLEALRKVQLSGVETIYKAAFQAPLEKSPQPRFFYVHLELPHYPYFYDAEGKPTAPIMALEGHQVDQKAYLGYLQYANKRYLDLVDNIIKNSNKPPVIILMSDHGFRHFEKDIPHQYYFMNLNAVLLPRKDYRLFYHGITAVNEFRALFNTEFGQNLPMLKDSTIMIYE